MAISSTLNATTAPSGSYTALILDIGDVLFTWSPETKTSISPKIIKQIVTSPAWNDFECGRSTQQECYAAVGSRLSIDPAEIAHALDEARTSLRFESELLAFVRSLKRQYNLSVYAMSNIAREDYEYLRAKDVGWDTFDAIFPSYASGIRKPDIGFYQKVIAKTGVDPTRAIFVDDKLDNVIAARSFGMHGIVFRNATQVMQAVNNLICDPIDRAKHFLSQNAGKLESLTNTGVSIIENFAQYLILDVTGDKSLIRTTERQKNINFFRGKAQLTTDSYPADLDTTSVGWTADKEVNEAEVHAVMDEMLKYQSEDGIIQVYFDHERPRVDPVVCVNVLSLFYAYGRGAELHKTLDWVTSVLVNRAYLEGTRYYKNPEAFLYFFSRLISHADAGLRKQYTGILAERLSERIGLPGDSLELAMRILACASLDIRDEVDLAKLLERQGLDGGWADGWFYRYGMTGIYIGNKGLTTAFAMNAINSVTGLQGPGYSFPPRDQLEV